MTPENFEMEDVEEELWTPIPGYEGLYSVSTWGRVRREANGRGAKPGRILKPGRNRNRNGYLRVNLCESGKPSGHYVHCLVLLAFVGPCPAGQEVLHRDGSRDNNFLSNLRYGTRSENMLDCHRYGGRAPGQKLTLPEVAEIRSRISSGQTQKDIALPFGVDRTTISKIKTGRTWAHRLDQTLAA